MGVAGKSKPPVSNMTPSDILAASLIYCISADGEVDEREIGHFVSIVGEGSSGDVSSGGFGALDRAVLIARTTCLDDFLTQARRILTPAQRMCILLNLVDSAMSDGTTTSEERAVLARFQAAFGILEERFLPYFEALHVKNDRSVLLDREHPHNRSGFVIEIWSLDRRLC